MSGRLEGSRVVVSGASRGLGRAVAEAAAAEGARLAVTATRLGHLDALVRRLEERGAEVHPLELDLGDPDSVAAAAARAIAGLGRIDGLVNAAGILGARGELVDQPLDVWRRVIDVDLTGTFDLTRRLIPAIAPGGVIVNVGSGAAGRAGWGAYAIAKLALDGLSGMLAEELAPREIRVVALNPGPTRTAMRAAAYPDEDPDTVPHPSVRAAGVIDVLSGADARPRVDLGASR